MSLLSKTSILQKDIGILAIVGDAVWSLYVREKLALAHDYKSGVLSKQTVQYVSAKAQAAYYYALDTMLDTAEKALLKRARNATSCTKAKNSTVDEYNKATAFEALLGFLHLANEKERLQEILDFCFSYSS